jgi:hypothetical protein
MGQERRYIQLQLQKTASFIVIESVVKIQGQACIA